MTDIQEFPNRTGSENKVLDTIQVKHSTQLFKNFSTMKLTFHRATDFENVPNRINALLIGKTGSGLSSSGNTALGKKAFIVQGSYFSVTNTIQSGSTRCGKFTLSVIDTPGLFNSQGKDNDGVLFEITKHAASIASGVHVILLICNLSTRFTDEECKVFSEVKTLFGSNTSQHVITVFTHGSILENQQLSLETFIKKNEDQTFLSENDLFFRQSIALENKLDDLENDTVQRNLIQCAICEVVTNNNGQPIALDGLKYALERLTERQQRKEQLPIVRNIIDRECERIVKGADEKYLHSILETNTLDEKDSTLVNNLVKERISLKDVKDLILTESGRWITENRALILAKLEIIIQIQSHEREIEVREEKLHKMYLEKKEREKKERLVTEQILFLSTDDLKMVLQYKYTKTLVKHIRNKKGIYITEEEIDEIIQNNSEDINALLIKKMIKQNEYKQEIITTITQNLLKLIPTKPLAFLKCTAKDGKLLRRDFIEVVAEIPFEPQCKGIDLEQLVGNVFKEEGFLSEANYIVAKKVLEKVTDVDIVTFILDASQGSKPHANGNIENSELTDLVLKKLTERIKEFVVIPSNDFESSVKELILQLMNEKTDVITDATEVRNSLLYIKVDDVTQIIRSSNRDEVECMKRSMDKQNLPVLLLEKLYNTIEQTKKCSHNGDCLLKKSSYEALSEWLKTMFSHFFKTNRTFVLDTVEVKFLLESISSEDLAHGVHSMDEAQLAKCKEQLMKDKKSVVLYSLLMNDLISKKRTCNHLQTDNECHILRKNVPDWLNNWVETYLETKHDLLYDIVEATLILKNLSSENFEPVLRKISVKDWPTVRRELQQYSNDIKFLTKSVLEVLYDSKSCNHEENCVINKYWPTDSSNSWLGNLISKEARNNSANILQTLALLHKENRCKQCLGYIGVFMIIFVLIGVSITMGLLSKGSI